MKRSDCYFGLHFDFHANGDAHEVGKSLDTDVLEQLITEVRPDFIQCDTKGHPGFASYVSKLGNACDLSRDVLRAWREATKKHNVPLYSHYSGVWDARANKIHPDWVAIDKDGKPFDAATSVFSPYKDELMIPQLLELAGEIGMDGVWVDGDCWGCIIDYSHWATEAWTAKTGTPAPNPPTAEYAEFCRQGFRDYVKLWVDTVHAQYPDFQMTSNWIYSSHMPEQPKIDVDFLSGDYAPNDSYRSARYEGRIFRHQGIPWDLMAWGFSSHYEDGESIYHTIKSARQLKQEAAAVLILGGGFQCYNIQPDGAVNPEIIPSMKELGEFVRARQAICHHAEPVPQVGIVMSEAAFYSANSRPFSVPSDFVTDLRGLVNLLCDAQHSVDMLPAHFALSTDLSAYPVLVVPELDRMEDALREKLLAYAENGGSLLLTGAHTAGVFGYALPDSKKRIVDFVQNGHTAHLYTNAALTGDAKLTPAEVMTFVRGKGKVTVLPVNMGTYLNQRSDVVAAYMDDLLRTLYTPIVTIRGSRNVEVMVNRKDGKLCVHLVNTSGAHTDPNVKQFTEIPELHGLVVDIHTGDMKPEEVRFEPGNFPASLIQYSGTDITGVRVTDLDIHTCITLK